MSGPTRDNSRSINEQTNIAAIRTLTPDIHNTQANQLFDEQGNVRGEAIIRTMTLNKELTEQLKRSREIGEYVSACVLSLFMSIHATSISHT
mgnify:CR=1 FL=1